MLASCREVAATTWAGRVQVSVSVRAGVRFRVRARDHLGGELAPCVQGCVVVENEDILDDFVGWERFLSVGAGGDESGSKGQKH